MSIEVKYIFNTQAVQIKGGSFHSWKVWYQNTSKFRYINDLLNKKPMLEPSVEQIEGARGDY